ncbi:RHS repeat-associated core domain-containing protein [Candidatus Woesearchaeota archaeon]|nr:RHS repeat-associated core domain-containing protein [Candidatus Woesearchaeota archaeon]
MKKRLIALFLAFIFITSTIYAAMPYKESLQIENFIIKQVQCSNNNLRILVESKSNKNLKLLFKMYSNLGNINIFSNQILKKLNSDWFLIQTNINCKDLLRLEANGYIDLSEKERIVYLNSESSYQFTGNEKAIKSLIQETSIQRASYIYLGTNLIERIDASNREEYYHQDHLGSTRVITDSNGNKLQKLSYKPFGDDLISVSYPGNKKYTGKEQDNNGLYYYGARYYDASTGRFISVDPSFKPEESGYVYVSNNPLRYIDTTGRQRAQTDTISVEYKPIEELSEYELLFLTGKVGLPISASTRDTLDFESYFRDPEDIPALAMGASLGKVVKFGVIASAICNFVYSCTFYPSKAYQKVEAEYDEDISKLKQYRLGTIEYENPEAKKTTVGRRANTEIIGKIVESGVILGIALFSASLIKNTKSPKGKINQPQITSTRSHTTNMLGPIVESQPVAYRLPQGNFQVIERSTVNRKLPPKVVRLNEATGKWVPVNPSTARIVLEQVNK